MYVIPRQKINNIYFEFYVLLSMLFLQKSRCKLRES